MIYLLTRPSDDTTTLIIQWLLYLKKDFVRINTLFDLPFITHPSKKQCIDDELSLQTIKPKQLDSFYFNGGYIQNPDPGIDEGELNHQVSKYVNNEISSLLTFFSHQANLNKTFGLNSYDSKKVNKLIVLKAAQELGLKTPRTAIVSSKEQLVFLKRAWKRIINKSIDSGVNIETEQLIIRGQKTEEVTDTTISKMADHFLPSLIQELIDKQYEVRVFFFNENFHSIAIFSQSQEATKVDGRGTPDNTTVRQVPYELPAPLKKKIICLMDVLGLNYGSLDLVFTQSDEYCFLEVNPYGQYGFLSSAGNFYIEEQIAQYL